MHFAPLTASRRASGEFVAHSAPFAPLTSEKRVNGDLCTLHALLNAAVDVPRATGPPAAAPPYRCHDTSCGWASAGGQRDDAGCGDGGRAPVVGIDGGRAGIASADGDTRFVTRKAGVNTRVLELGGPERATVVEDSRRARPLLEATHVGSSRSLRAPRGSRPRRGAARRRPLGRAERRPSSQSTGSGRPISRSTGAVDGNRDALAVHEHAEVDHPGRGLTTRAARRRLGESKRRRPTLPGP